MIQQLGVIGDSRHGIVSNEFMERFPNASGRVWYDARDKPKDSQTHHVGFVLEANPAFIVLPPLSSTNT